MKSKLMIIFSSLFIIIGIISIVLTHSALNSPQFPAQTTTTIPATTYIYLTEPPPLIIPENFAVEVSTVSQGVRVDVGINDTTPRVGGAVLVVIQITNVNSSGPVGFNNHAIQMEVFNSKGEKAGGLAVYYPGITIAPGYYKLPLHQNATVVHEWQVETNSYLDAEVKPGESYYIVVRCELQGVETIETVPIPVVVES
ncbi:MAG: hypothetical protein ACFFCW_27315 [Candidatus Hodarchaeota archaeon]